MKPHLTQRIAAAAMAAALTLTLATGASAAELADVSGHWAEVPLQTAVDSGLLQGTDGGLALPNSNLDRASMAAIVVRAFGTTQTADLSIYTDIPSGAWYVNSGELAGAVYMKIMNGTGDGTTMSPDKSISRQETFVILARALKLADGDPSVLDGYEDGGSVASWAAGSVAAMLEHGYIKGGGDGLLHPADNITRGEFAQIMYNIFGANYVKRAGSYEGSALASNDVMISTPDVTINGGTINGNVIIGEGVGEGDVWFNGVTVTGSVIVRGGGVNSIHFSNSSVGKILVSKIVGAVRVVADKISDIPSVAVTDGAETVTIEGSVTAVSVESDTPVVVKDATIESLTVSTDASVEISGSSVTTLAVSSDAKVEISGKSTVATLTVTAEAKVEITGSSTVATVEVPKDAEGAPSISIDSSSKVTTVNANSNVTVDGKPGSINKGDGASVTDSNGNNTTTSGSASRPSSGSSSTRPPAVTPDPSAPCDHNYTTTVTKEATCTQAGSQTKTCSKCNDTQTETIAALGHSYGAYVTTVAATCSKTGSKYKVCSACNDKQVEEIPTVDHTWTGVATIKDDATHEKSCSVCGATSAPESHTGSPCSVCSYKADVTNDGNAPAEHQHTWADDNDNTDNVTAATCTTAGTKNQKCTGTYQNDDGDTVNCTATRSVSTSALGHDWPKTGTSKDGVEANCATRAVTVFTCARDGCEVTREEPGNTDPTKHPSASLSKLNAVAATCTNTGLTEGEKCDKCGAVTQAQNTVKALGHDVENVEWTACKDDTTKHCKVCKRNGCGAEVDATAHTPAGDKTPVTNKAGYYTQKCSVCNTDVETQCTSHRYADQENTNPTGKCTDCGLACTHSYNNTGKCTTCGVQCAHANWTDGVCDECSMACTHSADNAWNATNGTCNTCGATHAHTTSDWSEGVCGTCGYTCKHNGEKTPSKIDSGDATNHNLICGTCGKTTGTEAHTFTYNQASNPTGACKCGQPCTNADNHAGIHKGNTCSTCGYAGAASHTFNGGNESNVVEATCCKDGSKTVTCTGENCNATEVQVNGTATGQNHTYDDKCNLCCAACGNADCKGCTSTNQCDCAGCTVCGKTADSSNDGGEEG